MRVTKNGKKEYTPEELAEMEANLSELGREALADVRRGFAVFPCVPRKKQPATGRGLNEWSTNEADIIPHWTGHPYDNIGIVCGTPSGGLLVLDFDIGDTKNGLATLKEWEATHGELPETATARTGSGGMHMFFRTSRTGLRPSVNADLGVDVRTDGSYVIAPGSIHPCGDQYIWTGTPEECDIADADDHVYDFLDYVQRNGGTEDTTTKKANGKFKLPETIKKGERDNVLYKYACHLRAIGRSDEEIEMSVAGANASRCKPPMEASDIKRITRQACKHEQGDGVREPDGPLPKVPNAANGGAAPIEIPRRKFGGIQTNVLAQAIIQYNHACVIDGAPAVWTGAHWEFGTRAINRCCLLYADDAKKQDKAEVVSYIMDKAPHVSSDVAFDGRYYVQFANCTIDAATLEKVTPTPRMFITGTLPIELPDKKQERNVADEFLESVSGHDEPTLEALKEIIGACMCSRRILSQAPMLIGTAGGAAGKASNGKSTYLNFLRAILGSENVSSLDIATLGQRFQAGRVVGKLANLGDDIPDGFLKGDELATFKKLVTGDAIYTDVKGSDGFEFRPSATMVFSMNSVPRLGDTTDGIFRRLYFAPFRNRFTPGTPGYDPDMAVKLAAPEVLQRGAWLGLQALSQLIARGGTLPVIPDMVAEVEEVRQSNDSVLRWMDDCGITIEWFNRKTTAEAYRVYKDWCEEAGERSPFSRIKFSQNVLDSMATDGNGFYLVSQSLLSEETGRKARTFVMKAG